MKFSFEGSPEELAQLLRTLMAGQASADVGAVVPGVDPQFRVTLTDDSPEWQDDEHVRHPSEVYVDGTEAFARPTASSVGLSRFDSLWRDFLRAETYQRQNLVRLMFADPEVVSAIRAGGGIMTLLVQLFGEPIELTEDERNRFHQPGQPAPEVKNVVSLIYTLAHLDGLLPEDLRIHAIPTVKREDLTDFHKDQADAPTYAEKAV